MMICLLLAFSFIAGQDQASLARAPDYQLGPQDVLMITVLGESDLTGERTVDSDGTVDLPWLGRVKVAGLSVRDAQDLLARRLVDGGFLTRPQVSIRVREYRSQNVYVHGEVAQPGAYPLTGDTTLMDLVNKARLLPTAGDVIQIYRPPAGTIGPVVQGGADTEVTRISKADLQRGRAGQSVSLRDGDTIFVPKAASIFVFGQVRTPGPYTYDGDLNVMQALTLAGGMTDRAAKNRIRIQRKQPDGTIIVLKDVKLTDIVQPGDTIEVPQRRI